MPGVFESVRVVDGRDKGLGGFAPDAGDRQQANDVGMLGGEGVESGFQRFEFRGEVIES